MTKQNRKSPKRLVIDIGEVDHMLIKSIASMKGLSLKDWVTYTLTEAAKKEPINVKGMLEMQERI